MNKPRKRVSVPGVVVYQRGKKWAYRIELDRDPLSGDRRWKYQTDYATEDEAWTKALEARTEHDRGQRVAPARRTVGEFIKEWLSAVEHSIKPSTYANYVDYTGAYVLPYMEKRKLQDVDVPMLNALYRRLLESGRCKSDTNTRMFEYWSVRRAAGIDPKPKEIADNCKVTIYAARHAVLRYRRGRIPKVYTSGLAPKTVKNVHRMLHRALSDAVAWRYLSYNPAVHASLPRERRSGGRRRRGATWTAEQLLSWLKVAIEDRDAGMWVLAATSGMRRSELAGVERVLLDMDDEDQATLTLEDTRVVVAGRAEESDGKTESGTVRSRLTC